MAKVTAVVGEKRDEERRGRRWGSCRPREWPDLTIARLANSAGVKRGERTDETGGEESAGEERISHWSGSADRERKRDKWASDTPI